jgi:hypothetical protein
MEPGLSSPAAFRLLLVRPPGQLASRIEVFDAENANEKARLSILQPSEIAWATPNAAKSNR